jgi:hypothetical protein
MLVTGIDGSVAVSADADFFFDITSLPALRR